MSYRKKLMQQLSAIAWCMLLVVIAIYFFVLVPGEFSGWKDYLTYHAFFLLLFITTERLLLPWITDHLYQGLWVCVYPFVLQFVVIFFLIVFLSILFGGASWQDLDWDISNFWHLLMPLLLPNCLAVLLFVARQGLQGWEHSERYQLQFLTQELNPHLLNTNLSKLRPLILWNTDIAVRFVKQNNVLFHYYLKNHKSLTIAMADELRQVDNVLKMEEISKQVSVFLTVDADTAVLDSPVPTMMLVNLLSNCFSYGISTDPYRPIQIQIWRDADNRVNVRVSNYKKALAPKEYVGTGTSLSRTADLLRFLDPHAKIHITQDDQRFTVDVVYCISM